MASNDSTSKTIIVALVLSLVCAIVVSTAAVLLKPIQEKNKLLDKRKNILAVAGLLTPGVDVDAAFKRIETRFVDLRTGQYVTETAGYSQRKASKDPDQSTLVPSAQDIAGIKRKANVAEVYLVLNEADNLEILILPVHGYGLWSTMYGFIALDNNLETVEGFGFYEQGETPGLGGEVDNPKWKAQWKGKKVYGPNGQVELHVIKGKVNPSRPESTYEVDGLAGATLTSNGVSNLIKFWMGKNGFEPYLDKLKAEGV